MKNKLTVLEDKYLGGKVVKRCSLEISGESKEYYFSFDEKYKDELECEKADAWLILLIHKMMDVGGEFFIDGTISSSLLDNLERYCAFWRAWNPNYKEISISTRKEFSDEHMILPKKAIMTFSGGVDACFTLYRHSKHLAGRNNKNIEKAVFLFGADIDNEDDFQIASFKAKEQCNDCGVDLILAETNFRKLPHNWQMEHMNVCVAVLHLFKNYPFKVVSSSMDANPEYYTQYMPNSSNFVTDRYLSTSRTPLLVDDEAFTRTQKAAVIKDWKVGLKNLRVCWQGEDRSQNCGKCEKCMRTMFNFLAAGAGEIEAFDKKAYTEINSNLNNLYTPTLYFWTEIVSYSQKNRTLAGKYFDVLKSIADGKYSKKKHHSFWFHLKRGKF